MLIYESALNPSDPNSVQMSSTPQHNQDARKPWVPSLPSINAIIATTSSTVSKGWACIDPGIQSASIIILPVLRPFGQSIIVNLAPNLAHFLDKWVDHQMVEVDWPKIMMTSLTMVFITLTLLMTMMESKHSSVHKYLPTLFLRRNTEMEVLFNLMLELVLFFIQQVTLAKYNY